MFRYNSTQTFVLAFAMDAYLKRREGPGARLWDMVRSEVFRPIGILHAPAMHTIEPAGDRGVPILAHGLYPTVDDVAKLVTLLQDGGRHENVVKTNGPSPPRPRCVPQSPCRCVPSARPASPPNLHAGRPAPNLHPAHALEHPLEP